MKKYIVIGLIVSFFLFSAPLLTPKALALEMSFQDFINILVSIGVISQDKIPEINSILTNQGQSTVSLYPACGSATSTFGYAQPTANLCSNGISGDMVNFANDGQWQWSCRGSNTTWAQDKIWCRTKPLIYPACGSATSTPSMTMPTTNLCSFGVLDNRYGVTADGTSRWYWGCIGSNTGWTGDIAWCFASKTASPAPTCIVTTDKQSYKVGDKINISYTSNNATYANWEQNSTNIGLGLSSDRLLTSGNVEVTANTSGSLNIKLLVHNYDTDGSCEKTISVTAASTPVYPACGSAANVASAQMPTANLCSFGTPHSSSGSTGDGTNRWYWGCVGSNTGWADDTAWCFAPKAVTAADCSRHYSDWGACNNGIKTRTLLSAIGDCSQAGPLELSTGCAYNPPPLPVALTPVYPACGSAANVLSAQTPVLNLCAVGTPTTPAVATDGSNQWFWGCVGSNTGWTDDTAWCFAPKVSDITTPVYPVCGTTKDHCTVGKPGSSGSTGDNRWYWACIGSNTGWTDDTAWCFAPKTSSALTGSNYAGSLMSIDSIIRLLKSLK